MASLVSPEKVRELLNDGISSPNVDNKRYVLLVLKEPKKMSIIATVVSHLARLIRYINLAVIKAIYMLPKRSRYKMFCVRERLFSCKDKINIFSASLDELRVCWIGICMCSTLRCSKKSLIL